MDNKINTVTIPTGIEYLDDMLYGGLRNSELVILAGPPRLGKTFFATGTAYNVANKGIPVGFFSLEVSAKTLANSLPDLKMHDAKEIYFDDTPDISIMDLQEKCREMKSEKNVGLIIVDYLQLIQIGNLKAETREKELAIFSSALKQIACELDIPVFVTAQLGRNEMKLCESITQVADRTVYIDGYV